MTGPVEEVGSTARSLIDAMKGHPATLALTIANLALLIFIYYALHSGAQFREKMLDQVLANSSAIHTMLSQRSVACPPTNYNLQSDETKPAEPPPKEP
jgi:hypothetical protein